MEEERLEPKRRFKGYENTELSNIKLGDYALIKGRLGWKSLKREEYIENGPSMIAGRHIKHGIIDWDKVDHIPLWRYEESPEIMLKNNDVIFSKDGSLGNPALITDLKDKATINATMMLVRIIGKLSASYFYHILNSKRFYELVNLKVSGSSIPHLFQEDMKNFQFYAPVINEQKKIGKFFKVLDERIANQERKIAKVKSLKEAYLMEMFPQEGETVPKRRFKGFDGEWYKKTLGNFGTVEMNKLIFKGQTSVIGDVPFYKIGTFGKKADSFISYELFNEYKTKYPYPEPGDILISAAGSIGRTIEYQGEDAYYQDSNIVWLKHDGKLSNLFLKQFYNFTNWSSLEGSTIKRLYNRDILEATIQ